jgi:hypothetical protein
MVAIDVADTAKTSRKLHLRGTSNKLSTKSSISHHPSQASRNYTIMAAEQRKLLGMPLSPFVLKKLY